jgi:molybdopterin molybdotransferase
MDLLSLEEARRRLLASVNPLDSEIVPLKQSLGRVLAKPVTAPDRLPRFDHSSMDGYAVRAADTGNALPSIPIRLDVIGEATAGGTKTLELGSGQAIRVTTGAALPLGADAVIPVEDTDEPGPMTGTDLPPSVSVLAAVGAGDHVRPAGLDVDRGEEVLSAGHRLRPQDLGMLAALGLPEAEVVQKPRVGVLSTGDEVVPLGAELSSGRIWDSNGIMISSMLEAEGCDAIDLGIARDTRESVRDRLAAAEAEGASLIISSAGVSMGAHDYVRTVVEEAGDLAFWRVNIRPGKPLVSGSFAGIPFLGLPGNPVSAWMTSVLFVRPLVQRLQGMRDREDLTVYARIEEPIESDGRESYLRGIVERESDGYHVELTGSQDSGVLSSLVIGNGLIRIPAGTREVKAGSTVEVVLLPGLL